MTLSACSTSVQGRAIRAPGDPATPTSAATTRPAHAPVSAHDLLLRDGESTPLGEASPAPVGDSYYTSARPPECSAALPFVNSPLLPAGSTDHADSSYRFASPALYAESVSIYANDLNEHDVVWNGFSAVTSVTADAAQRLQHR